MPSFELEIPKPIANEQLMLADVPAFDVLALDLDWGSGASSAEWSKLWEFALTIDGYEFTGLDRGELGVLSRRHLDQRVDADWLGDEYDLGWLRSFLFLWQRMVCKWELFDADVCEPEWATYLDALVVAIRQSLAT